MIFRKSTPLGWKRWAFRKIWFLKNSHRWDEEEVFRKIRVLKNLHRRDKEEYTIWFISLHLHFLLFYSNLHSHLFFSLPTPFQREPMWKLKNIKKIELAHNETGIPFYPTSAAELVSEGIDIYFLSIYFPSIALITTIKWFRWLYPNTDCSFLWLGDIKELFAKAYTTAPSIIFINEIDAISFKRMDFMCEMDRWKFIQLMTCLDELNRFFQESDVPVILLRATNKLNIIDLATSDRRRKF